MKSRTGKIARLPKKIRDQLNRRLQNGQLGPEILAWLNALPSVRRVLREQFSGQPILQQNLSQWRIGGYADWLRHQETQANTRWMVERSDDVDTEENGQYLCERLARVLTADLVQRTHELVTIKNPKDRWKQFREIALELSRLRYGTQYARTMDLSWERWNRIVEKEDTAEAELQREQRKNSETQEEYLEKLMNLLHRPDLREWVRTDWPSKEAEMARLREIYHLRPGSTNTPKHPCQKSENALRHGAVYNYPTQSETHPNKPTEAYPSTPTHTETK
jgi:hypothetical protein